MCQDPDGTCIGCVSFLFLPGNTKLSLTDVLGIRNNVDCFSGVVVQEKSARMRDDEQMQA